MNILAIFFINVINVTNVKTYFKFHHLMPKDVDEAI